MVHTDYIYSSIWFAWYPVKTEEGQWAWLENVQRVVDERPEAYLGLLPEYKYYKLK